MKVVFRVDASLQTGSGHLMRCLTLADGLSERGYDISFLAKEHPSNLNFMITEKGYQVYSLPLSKDINSKESYAHWLGSSIETELNYIIPFLTTIRPDLLIVDHYAIDYLWEKRVKPFCSKLVVIDDLADRQHDCDLLLDQTVGRKESDYRSYVPNLCQLLLGASYALLRPEFFALREKSIERRQNGNLQRVMVSLGGVDKDNMTTKVLNGLKNVGQAQELEVVIVMGSNAPHITAIEKMLPHLPFKANVLTGIKNMAEYMTKSDLAIGAAGSTSWERCCLGLPTLMVVIAENQQTIAQNLVEAGAAILLNEPLDKSLIEMVDTLDSKKLSNMSKAGRELVDGQGVGRVVNKLESL